MSEQKMADSEDFIVKGPEVELMNTPFAPLGEFFFSCVEKHGDKVAQIIQVDDGDVLTVTYADVLRDGKVVAELLREHGITVGNTVLVFCGSTVADFLHVMLGTLFAGAALAPVNSELDYSDILHVIGVFKPQLIITNKKIEQTIREVLSQHSSSLPMVSMAAIAQRLKERPDVTDFVLGKVEDPVNDVALVMCSSGTTGTPKAVEMTHFCVLQMIYGTKDFAIHIRVLLNLAGPSWISCIYATMLSLTWGLTTVVANKFEEDLFLGTIQQYKVNYTVLNPHHLVLVAKFGSTDGYDLSSLLAVVYGGGPMSQAMLNQAQRKLRTRIVLAYAMTECTGICSPNMLVVDKPTSVGRAGPNALLKVVDLATGKAVGPDQEGEIWVKSPLTFKGYRGNPEATRETVDEDGFLHTGDIGYYDKDGYFYIVDRIKELFKYNGFHVNPVDIEDVLLQHEQVLEAAVVGIYHEADCNHATAFVVRAPGASVTQQDLVKRVQDALPYYKWLYGGVRFIDIMPRSAPGKVLKYILRKQEKV